MKVKEFFLIMILIVFFMLLYVYVGGGRETYQNVNPDLKVDEDFYKTVGFVDPNNMYVVQGNGVPDIPMNKIIFDQNDPAANNVDGTGATPKQIFPFAFNKCDVRCCGHSPLTCSGGCVCIPQEQMQFLSSRGFNNKYDKCSYDEY